MFISFSVNPEVNFIGDMSVSNSQWLNSMLTDVGKLQREAVYRRKSFLEISVPKALVDEHKANGWEFVRELKTKTKLRKPSVHDEHLENRVWHLLYLLGYPEISQGRNFKVLIKRKGADAFYKQIDVLAKDDETVIVTECKSSAVITKRTLQKDIEEFANLKSLLLTQSANITGQVLSQKLYGFS